MKVSRLLLTLVLISTVVYAAPPSSPYTPGETLSPTCSPGDSNCTVSTYSAGSGLELDGVIFYLDTDTVLQPSNNLSDLDNTSTSRTNLGLGTISTQDSDNIDIDGGALDGVSIGSGTASSGIFTTLSTSSTTTLGDGIDDSVTINGTIQGASPFVFEGNTENEFETTFAITDPTGDRTITIPDGTGTLALTSDINSGDITSVIAGTGLTDGGLSGDVTLNLDTSSVLQPSNNLSDVDDASEARTNLSLGTLATLNSIDISDNTNLSSGNGISVSGDSLAIDPTYTQRRVSGTCSSGSSIRVINEDGSVTCETDDDNDTTYSAGTGLSLDGTTFSLESSINAIIGAVTPAIGTFTNLTSNGNTILGSDNSDTITANGIFQGSSPLVFEGSSSDSFETTFSITDPTADRTITFPNTTGTVALTSDLSSIESDVSTNTEDIENLQATSLVPSENKGGYLITERDIGLSIGGDVVGEGEYIFEVTGKALIQGTVAADGFEDISDRRFKKEISKLSYGLDEILNINSVKYKLKNKNDYELGYIAQELYEILPEIVSKPIDEANQIWRVNYSRMVSVITNAIQEFYSEFIDLKQKVEEQENTIKNLEQRIEKLEKLINENE